MTVPSCRPTTPPTVAAVRVQKAAHLTHAIGFVKLAEAEAQKGAEWAAAAGEQTKEQSVPGEVTATGEVCTTCTLSMCVCKPLTNEPTISRMICCAT